MAKKLRPGLIDPHDIPQEDIQDYVATTYAGYLREVQNRLWEVNRPLFGSGEFTVDFYREVLSLQLRICIELLCFAVADFDQVTGGLIGRSKRAKIDIDPILKKRKNKEVWPSAVDPNWQGQMGDQGQTTVPQVVIPDFTNAKEISALKGRLDDLVHGQRRPRPIDEGRLSINEVLQIGERLKHFADRQVIVDHSGQGWFVDSRPEYRRPTDMQSQVRVVRIASLTES
ncbi:MAG: hypothetical protein AAF222_14615 [Pseudomonadota bacterium]